MDQENMPRDEFHNWRDCNSQGAKGSGYKALKIGTEVAGGYKVGDVVEVVTPDKWSTFEVGDRAFVSNIRTEDVGELVLTTLDPKTLPKGHIAHGDFINAENVKRAIEPVTPEEEAEAIASIIKIREVS
jgi:hypothetical protein